MGSSLTGSVIWGRSRGQHKSISLQKYSKTRSILFYISTILNVCFTAVNLWHWFVWQEDQPSGNYILNALCWKGQFHDTKTFNQYFLCMHWWFSRSFKSLSLLYPLKYLTFYLLFWNYLLILKMFIETLLIIPFSVIGRCSTVSTPHWLQGKCAGLICHRRLPRFDFTESQAASCMHFQCQIASLGSLKRVTERIFKISNFKGGS